ncbi:MAG TPA: phytanoyl-CoA dioxygenase family protein [Armatimonadota bacterium]|jgi:ectoine hydroxylase-related dioxygenase (phytanoyl-CoA dioxygenase family)
MSIVEARERFETEGYVVGRGLFSPSEVADLREHYMELRESGTYAGDFDGVDIGSADPLKRYPRMIHMHRWDEASLKWLIDSRLNQWLTGLAGAEPYAVQTMLYFKPAGARGQALHQDQFYLRVEPGTCLAAWLALDACDEENGCMRVVPRSHKLPVLCTVKADTTQSFTDVTVPVPDSLEAVPVLMDAGDVLFFNGSVIHGSYPNTSETRFRRALIGHYIVGEAQKVASYYHPVLRMDGSEVELGVSSGGGPCGVWAQGESGPVVTMTQQDPVPAGLHE